jgi:hypothetical protein
MIVRVHVESVIAKIAQFVANPRLAQAEHAFHLSFEERGRGTYYVDAIEATAKGTVSSVSTPRELASAHTHYIENYRQQQCHVGWPSGEDMRWIFGVAAEHGGGPIVHLCSALEGTYIVACRLYDLTLTPDLMERNGRDIFAYFSSSHGHRCNPGRKDEGSPGAAAFVKLAHAFRFTGPLCERHAGERSTCTPPTPHRRHAAALYGEKQVFFVRFVPHQLAPRGGVRTRTYFGRDAETHLANINGRFFDHAGTVRVDHDGTYADLRVGPSLI